MNLKKRGVLLRVLKESKFCGFLLVAILGCLLTVNAMAGDDIIQNIGVGVGIPYGIFGVNYTAEKFIGDSFSLGPSVGLGFSSVGFNWDIGLQARFLGKDSFVRPGLLILYGINTIVEDPNGDKNNKEGITIGGNVRFQYGVEKKHCIDFFIGYPVTPNLDETRFDRKGDILIGVGYAYKF